MFSDSALTRYLKAHSALHQEEISQISSFFCEESLKPEEPLLVQGNWYRKIVFVSEGILRVFIIGPDGEEIVKNFLGPEDFFADTEGLEKNRPSVINVTAITECRLLTLSESDAKGLTDQLPKWANLMREGALQAMNKMVRNQEFLRIGDATVQYRYFVENFPDLARQVPLKYIASYLRITQSSLSRIRKQDW